MKRAAGRAPPPQHALRSAVSSPRGGARHSGVSACGYGCRDPRHQHVRRTPQMSLPGAPGRPRLHPPGIDGEPFVADVSVSRVIATGSGEARPPMLEWRSLIRTNNRSAFSADSSHPAGSGGVDASLP